jgi:NAD(P)-dependent dehydrogenase (short-subunit alcohol dehydrogenase family)
MGRANSQGRAMKRPSVSNPSTDRALIVGAGSGLSAALIRLLCSEGFIVAAAARDVAKLGGLSEETGARLYQCDAAIPEQVSTMFARFAEEIGPPTLVVYNASSRRKGSIADVAVDAVLDGLLVSCYGGFLVGQAAARSMIASKSGSIFFTGASASVKGYAGSASFAMGKFGLRGLAQSMARELAPKNIHVGHIIVDGAIAETGNPEPAVRRPDDMLEPSSVAATYLQLHRQHRSAWTWELEVRPWVEAF